MNPPCWQTSTAPFELLDLLTERFNRRKAIALRSALDISDWCMLEFEMAGETEEVSVLFRQLLKAHNDNEFMDDAYTWVDSEERTAELIAQTLCRQAEVIREVVAPPHLLIDFAPEWRTTDVINLAQAMYSFSPKTWEEDESRFTPMPILGDALEEAGCNILDVLQHCRSGAGHKRECWVLDLILEPPYQLTLPAEWVVQRRKEEQNRIKQLSAVRLHREELTERIRSSAKGSRMKCPFCEVEISRNSLLRHCDRNHSSDYL